MSSLASQTTPVLQACRDRLVEVGVTLAQTDVESVHEVVALMDRRLREVYEQLDATRRLLILYREARPAPYDPAETIRTASAQVATIEAGSEGIRATRRCEGDAEQVVELLRVLSGSISLEAGERVRTTVRPGEAQPHLRVECRALPARLTVDDVYDLEWEDWEGRWRHATGGGEVVRSGGEIRLFLEGRGNGDPAIPGLEAPLETLKRAVALLRSWRGAIGHYEPGYAAPAEIASMYRETVDNALNTLDGLAERI